MQPGLNFNGYNLIKSNGNTALNNQSINFKAQTQASENQSTATGTAQYAVQNPQGIQNSKVLSHDTFVSSGSSAAQGSIGTSNKLLIGALAAAAGTAIIALVCKIKGKNAPNTEKAAQEAVSAASSAASKAEGAVEGAESSAEKPKGILNNIRAKAKSFADDVKKGYEEHTPVPEKPAAPSAPAKSGRKKRKGKKRTSTSGTPPVSTPPAPSAADKKVGRIIATGFSGVTDSASKILSDAESFAKKGQEAAKTALKAVTDDTKTKDWAEKIISDFTHETSSSIKRAGIGKSNAFNRIDADNWLYNEGYTKNLATKTMHAKRRICVTPDEITVVLDNAKTKKGVNTAGQLFKVDKTTGGVTEYSGYKVSPDGAVKYKKGMKFVRGESMPELYIEGYEKLADGTEKISRKTETTGSCIFDSEKFVKLSDGSESCSRKITRDKTTGEIMQYVEGEKLASDGTLEHARVFNSSYGEYSYGEGVKMLPDGSETAARKILLSPDNKPLSCSENYQKAATGEITADKRVEYAPDGTPEIYFEDYKETPGGITYSFKAEFNGTQWLEV